MNSNICLHFFYCPILHKDDRYTLKYKVIHIMRFVRMRMKILPACTDQPEPIGNICVRYPSPSPPDMTTVKHGREKRFIYLSPHNFIAVQIVLQYKFLYPSMLILPTGTDLINCTNFQIQTPKSWEWLAQRHKGCSCHKTFVRQAI